MPRKHAEKKSGLGTELALAEDSETVLTPDEQERAPGPARSRCPDLPAQTPGRR